MNGHLATITSAAEDDFLRNVAEYGDANGYYLGGTDRDEEGERKWITGETWSYENWDSNEPNNSGGSQDYAVMERSDCWQWDDYCNSSNCPFICEWDYKVLGGKMSDWAKPEMEKAEEMGLIPEVLQGEDLALSISRLEFAAVAVKVFENLTGVQALPTVTNPFTDTNDTEVLKAYNMGITDGISATSFSPEGSSTGSNAPPCSPGSSNGPP